jgi:hypothetical protein
MDTDLATTPDSARFASLMLRLWKYHRSNQQPDGLSEAAKKHWRLWLLPEVVAWYEQVFRTTLVGKQQQELMAHIQTFREIAERARAGQEPTVGELDRAHRTLLAIDRWWPVVSPSAALEAVDEALTDPKAAKWVVGYDFLEGKDWGGDPAVWVWMIVEDATPDDPAWRGEWWAIRELAGQKLDRVTPGVFFYPGLRIVTEQQDVLLGIWE